VRVSASGPTPDPGRTPTELSSRLDFLARTSAAGKELPAVSVLLANIAYRVQGEFAWDAAATKSDRDDVNAMLKREYRKGWQV